MKICKDCGFYDEVDEWCNREDKEASQVKTSCPVTGKTTEIEMYLEDLAERNEFDELVKKTSPLDEREVREAAIKVLMADGKSREEAEKEMLAWEKSIKEQKNKK